MKKKRKLDSCDSNLLRGNTESILLFLIKEQPNAYGYQLIKEIEKRSSGFFQLKEGTVYPALHKLENMGLIQGRWIELTREKEKRCYRISAKGRRALEDRISMWRKFSGSMDVIFNSNKPVGGEI